MPRKALLVLAVVVGAIAIPAGTAATVYSLLDYQSAVDSLLAIDSTIDPPPNDPNKDFAVGGFHGVDGNNVGFSAQSGPLGENAQGKLSETIPFGLPGFTPSTYQGRFVVTCLVVFGNDAGIGLHPTDAASNDQVNDRILGVHDSGLPGGAGDLYDFANLPASSCGAIVGFAADLIERGNILVNDALP